MSLHFATFAEANAARQPFDEACNHWGKVLESFPKGEMGLTPDHIKASQPYGIARAEFDKNMRKLKAINSYIVKHFKKENAEYHRTKREAKRGAL